ncbi:hypothetical protein BKY58_24930 [Klebsiella pneumoniae]|nr:hypothetical protein BKY58_24930 [Klebsiella pneumoniae]
MVLNTLANVTLGGRLEVLLEVWLEPLVEQARGLQLVLLCQFWGLRPGLLLVLCWGGLWLVQLRERLPAQPLMDSCLTDISVAIVVIPLTRRL